MLYDTRWKYKCRVRQHPEPWQQTLFEAAQYLRRHGWGQTLDKPCILHAILQVAYNRTEYFKAVGALTRRLGEDSAAEWNDRPGRTKVEAITALELSAEE
jgi:hypothetical protein